MNRYPSGTRVRSAASFTDISGIPANPSTVEFRCQPGAGTVQLVTDAVHDADGLYHYDIDTSGWAGPGNLLYMCQWDAKGSFLITGDDFFEIEPPAL